MNFLLRILIAVVFVVALLAVMPPFLHVIGFTMNGDIFTIFKVVVAIGAICYVVWGPPVPRPWQS
jgi:hypothetical protein